MDVREPHRIPFGSNTSITIDLPSTWDRIQFDRADRSNPIVDYRAALTRALDEPIGGLDLINGLHAGSAIALVVDDPSRWTPVPEALPLILDRLQRIGIRDHNVSISVGVGRHHSVDPEAMARRVGPEIAARFACYSPPVDNQSAYSDLGETDDGLPVRIFRPVAEADLRILVGSVLPHLQAGFGGGYKLIAPGCAHRSTLGAVHRRGLDSTVPDAARLLGSKATVNPMRRAVRSIVGKLGRCFSVSHLIGAPGEFFQVAAGEPDLVQDTLASEVERRYRTSNSPELADVVIASNFPWPGDPMQSFKVLLNHRAAGRTNGALVGFFWTDLSEIDRSLSLSLMRGIAATGLAGAQVLRYGLTSADRVAAGLGLTASFMIRWARELVVDRDVFVFAPALRERVGSHLGPVRLFDNQHTLWAAVTRQLAIRGVSTPLIRIFPEGGLTYATHSEGPLRGDLD
jgi:lactate racemase